MAAALPRFLCLDGGSRLAWKMDAELTAPLVRSSGNLDALDALVTCRLLAEAAGRVLGDCDNDDAATGGKEGGEEGHGRRRHGRRHGGWLAREMETAERLVRPWWRRFASSDPLDLGEALWLAHWFARGDAGVLARGGVGGGLEPAGVAFGGGSGGSGSGDDNDDQGGFDLADASDAVAARALAALDALFERGHFDRPYSARLAFRELGAALGVQAVVSRAPELPAAKAWARRVAALHAAWGAPARLAARDADITPVMWAASVLPRAWLRG